MSTHSAGGLRHFPSVVRDTVRMNVHSVGGVLLIPWTQVLTTHQLRGNQQKNKYMYTC